MHDETSRTQYLTPADVGRIAGVTPGAVRALTARGRLPVAAVTAGGVHLYTQETAERYAAERAARRSGGAVADEGRGAEVCSSSGRCRE